MKTIKYNIPGIADHFELNKFFIILQQQHPEWFIDNVAIGSVFGNFHFCIWDGGRNFSQYRQYTKEEINNILNFYGSLYIPVRFVFTNPVIKEEHLYNRFCNLVLECGDRGNNEIVVNSPLLEEYIRDKYPGYRLISSTTKRITSPEKALEEIANPNYYQICLDYDLNKKKDFIESIPQKDRHKVEFLVNAICHAHCPIRHKHYEWTGIAQESFLRDKYSLQGKCTITETSVHPSILGKGNNFTVQEIQEYNKMGFEYFKLEGRTLPSPTMFSMYLYYMIKPEAYFQVIEMGGMTEGIFYNYPNSEFYFENPIYRTLYNCSSDFIV